MSIPNQELIAFWNAVRGPKHTRLRDPFVGGAAPHSALALAKHAPRSGARVIDIGCGFGETTRDLARLVGPKGSVFGFDCCDAFLAIARTEARDAGVDNLSYTTGDAQSYTFDGSFDLVFARFGTMFFDGPKAALRNIRNALRPGGRLLHVTWRPLAANPWVSIPKEIALRHIPLAAHPAEDRPRRPGPFSMADPDFVRSTLEQAGYTDVTLEAVDAPTVVGRDLDEAIDIQLELGPAGDVLREAGDVGKARRSSVIADLRAALEPYVTARGVVMGSSSWTVTATNPK